MFIVATGRLMLQRITKQQNFQRVEKPWNTDTLLNRFKFEIRRKYVQAMENELEAMAGKNFLEAASGMEEK